MSNSIFSDFTSEQRYASAKCRIDIAKSYLCDAKRHFKKGDYIAMLSYMHWHFCVYQLLFTCKHYDSKRSDKH